MIDLKRKKNWIKEYINGKLDFWKILNQGFKFGEY